MENCMTDESIVIAPTAILPPYFNRDELKHTMITLSLACITNGDIPSATHGSSILPFNLIFLRRIFNCVFFPSKKDSTHIVDNACETTVASAAPRTPIPNPYINTGSSTIFVNAPISTESIPVYLRCYRGQRELK